MLLARTSRCALGLMILFLSPAIADSVGERMTSASPTSLAQAFLGFCLQNNANPSQTLEVARALKLKELPEEFKPLLAPADPSAEFHGFLVNEGEGAPFALGIVFGELDGERMASCTIANPYIASAPVASALLEMADLQETAFDETQMGQRTRVWDTSNVVDGSIIFFIDSEKMGSGGATISFVRPISN